TLGQPHSEDPLLHEETDERFNIGAGRTRDGEYLLLECSSHTTTEERFLRAATPESQWQLIEPRRDNIEYYADHRSGLFYLRVNDTGRNFRFVTTSDSAEITFPEPVYTAHPHTNRIFDTKKYRYGYQSLVTPGSVFEYDIASGESRLLKQIEVPGNFDKNLYASERLFAKAPDGVEVPVSLVYRK